MAKYKLIAFSEPVQGREDDYEAWYENVHIDQVLAVKGFTSAQRFRLKENLTGKTAAPFSAIYNIETDNLQSVMDTMSAILGTEKLSMSDAVNMETSSVLIYEEMGPEQKA